MPLLCCMKNTWGRPQRKREKRDDYQLSKDGLEFRVAILPLIKWAAKREGWNPESPDPSFSSAPYMIYNIGNSHPVKLTSFIEAIEKALGKKARWQMMPMQPGDVPATYANVDDLSPEVGIASGREQTRPSPERAILGAGAARRYDHDGHVAGR